MLLKYGIPQASYTEAERVHSSNPRISRPSMDRVITRYHV